MTDMPSFDANPFTVVRASGSRFWDDDGREYLDFTSGLWNVPLGYSEHRIVDAVESQLRRLPYATLFRQSSEPAVDLAERLLAITPDGFSRVFYNTSGGGAVETAMKLVRRWHALRGSPRRTIVGLRDSYHGTMYGAMTVTGQEIDQVEYTADLRYVTHVPANDVEALRDLFKVSGSQIAGVFVEPVLGNGCTELETDFVKTLFEVTQESGALLVADEVATGFGRTGSMFAIENWPGVPDVLILSKAINNGYLPLAATLTTERVTSTFDESGVPFLQGETQSGNPAACAAAIAALDMFSVDEMLTQAREVGDRLESELDTLKGHPSVAGQHGAGAMRAVRLQRRDGSPISGLEVTQLLQLIRHHGVIAYGFSHGVMFFPPFIATQSDVRTAVKALRYALEQMEL